MKVKILEAKMTYTKADGYVGQVQFEIDGSSNQYEMTLHSRKATEWGYGLFFLNESGDEDQLLALEDELEEDDELFDFLVQAAQEKLVRL
ncbi:hypothetical protein [Paenibacillus radicis (ex Gao et al. 2016)]|uniref:Uncharacterized protein n=1 Tax=Paenibacillus radicis (ex Gao et al. 2016) TaxID=1737354 RepID=A0A917M657_9BACL|nr:hypothetical protein [Paenibacillus radicis (ex Gao et al. 2016)]GGG79787.1 hypothetical protein GCM10010918_41100 [Paenibacillus radicis (ex Gao et al. 2016)]